MNDQAWLDEVFERLHSASTEGEILDIEALKAERPHLAAELNETFSLVRGMAVGPAPAPREILGFEILSELGSGASGSVFLARRSRIGGRPVALKVLSLSASQTDRGRRRFLGEMRALAAIDHPGVVRVLDIVEEGALVAFAMQWIEGETLAGRIEARRSGARPAPPGGEVRTVCHIGVTVARALGAVHRAGFLHRDIKPQNILLEQGPDKSTPGRAVLSDFGLVRDEAAACETREGHFLGTLAYASPEQLNGAELDARSDIYSLGASLFEALTWSRPFRGRTTAELAAAIPLGKTAPPHPRAPKLPRDLSAILAKAMEVDPKQRYASADDFADDLGRLLALEPVAARPQGLLLRSARALRRHRSLALTALVTTTLLLLTLLPLLSNLAGRERRQLEGRVLGSAAERTMLGADLGLRSWMSARSVTTPAPSELDVDRVRAALELFEQALELIPASDAHRDGFELERDSLKLALFAAGAEVELADLHPGLDRARATAAAWRSGGTERILSDPRALADLDPTSRRALGLLSFLAGDLQHASLALGGLAAVLGTHPLDDAILGRAKLARGQAAAAMPHLARAVRRFKSNAPGGLLVAAADASIATGDRLAARIYLERARHAAAAPRDHELRRVEADLAWLEGDLERAFRGYEALLGRDYLAHQRLGEFREAEGWFERALSLYVSLVIIFPNDATHRRNLMRCAERYWRTLDDADRRRVLRQSLDAHIFDFGGLIPLMRGVLASPAVLDRALENLAYPTAGSHDPAHEIGVAPPVHVLGDFRLGPEVRAFWDQLEAPGSLIDFARRARLDELDLRDLFALSPSAKDAFVDAWVAGEVSMPPQPAPVRILVHFDAPAGSFSVRLQIESGDLGFATDALVLGDLDGDGHREFALSTPVDPSRGTGPGKVAVFDGRSGAELYALTGGRAFERFGTALAALGDLDGDGLDDFAVSAPGFGFADSGPGFGFADSGPVRIFSARTGKQLGELHPDGDFGGDTFGTRLTALADYDGDGVPELAVSAPVRDAGAPLAGGLEVFSGRTLERLVTLAGDEPMDYFGGSAASIPDIDGDGRPDLAVAAAQSQGQLRGYVDLISSATWARVRRIEAPAGRLGFGAALLPLDWGGGALAITSGLGDPLRRTPGSVHVLPLDGPGPALFEASGDGPLAGFGNRLVAMQSGRLGVVSFSSFHPRDAQLEVFDATGKRLATLPGCTGLEWLGGDEYLLLFAGPGPYELGISSDETGSALLIRLSFD